MIADSPVGKRRCALVKSSPSRGAWIRRRARLVQLLAQPILQLQQKISRVMPRMNAPFLLFAMYSCSSATPAIELVFASYTSSNDCSGGSTNSTVIYPTSLVPTPCAPEGEVYSRDYWIDESTTRYHVRSTQFAAADTTCSGTAVPQSTPVDQCFETGASSSVRYLIITDVADAVFLSQSTYSTATDCTGAVTESASFQSTAVIAGRCSATSGGSVRRCGSQTREIGFCAGCRSTLLPSPPPHPAESR